PATIVALRQESLPQCLFCNPKVHTTPCFWLNDDLMFTIDSKSNIYSLIISFSVFLFYAINQSVSSGYSYGASLLLLTGLCYLAGRPVLRLATEEKTYVYALIGFFVVAVFVCLFHGN